MSVNIQNIIQSHLEQEITFLESARKRIQLYTDELNDLQVHKANLEARVTELQEFLKSLKVE